ncbi:DNA lyase [Candidatus Pacearchaeota archaeon]|nr:DNA lyase [Candidatus Pacearchaeota archaeon]
MKELHELYQKQKDTIQKRLLEFKSLREKDYMNEFLFCLLTPQSNAQRCWQAVEEIVKLKRKDKSSIARILKTRTRFHNNKAGYVVRGLKSWDKIQAMLTMDNVWELRNTLAENVKGYGLKEAGHFLRNIGKSDNKVAILDRHILRNLKALNVIDEESIRNKKHYHELEQKFLSFSTRIGIPIDELDLFFWSKENGQLFK